MYLIEQKLKSNDLVWKYAVIRLYIGGAAEISSNRIAEELNYLFDIYSSLTVCFILTWRDVGRAKFPEVEEYFDHGAQATSLVRGSW